MANINSNPANSTPNLQKSFSNISITINNKLPKVSYDDLKIIKDIQSSHAHDARQVNVKPVLDVVEDILLRSQHTTLADFIETGHDDTDAVNVLEEKMGGAAAVAKGTMLEELAIAIQKVCCEFTCKCTAGDGHASAMAILNAVGSYSWDVKVVIALAAFAVTYGELWLVIHQHTTNPLARSIAVLKQTPENSEINGVLKSKFGDLNHLTKLLVEVSKTLIDFRLLPSKYITPEDPPLSNAMNHIASASYWAIRAIVACGAQIVNIGITSGLIGSATEAWDLSSLSHKVQSIHEQLVQRLTICYEFIEEKKNEEAYNNLILLFKTPQKDNVKILKTLIYASNDMHPLVEVSTKKRVGSPTRHNIISTVISHIVHHHHNEVDYDYDLKQVHIDVLRGKTVLLFISDLDVSEEELMVLKRIYESRKNKNEHQYEIVWIPVVDRTMVTWTKEHENKFRNLQYKMPWYTLFHHSLLSPVSIRYIKEVWGFVKKQIVVALDQTGKVVSQNALHMMLIWGNLAYPFTTHKEEELWKKQTWSLDFVLDSIHPEIPKWLAQGDVNICLFGGEDIEWIRKYTNSMKDHAKTSNIKLELIYVGKHNAKEAVKKIMETINSEKLAHTLPDMTNVWYFWTRLESILYSKMHHGKNVSNDEIVKEVMSVMSFDGGDQGWGLIGRGSAQTEIIKGKGDLILHTFSKMKEWEVNIGKLGFLGAFREHLKSLFGSSSTHHCNRLVLPAIEGAGAPSVVACADCGRPMDKYILYRCCTG